MARDVHVIRCPWSWWRYHFFFDRKRFDRDREEKTGHESFTIGAESLHHRANCKIARSNNSKNVIVFLQKWKNRINTSRDCTWNIYIWLRLAKNVIKFYFRYINKLLLHTNYKLTWKIIYTQIFLFSISDILFLYQILIDSSVICCFCWKSKCQSSMCAKYS